MADPVLFCALAYTSFLVFMGYHGDVSVYAKDYASSMYVAEQAGDIADRLARCEGREREAALLAKLGRAAADQAHVQEDRLRRDGPSVRY